MLQAITFPLQLFVGIFVFTHNLPTRASSLIARISIIAANAIGVTTTYILFNLAVENLWIPNRDVIFATSIAYYFVSALGACAAIHQIFAISWTESFIVTALGYGIQHVASCTTSITNSVIQMTTGHVRQLSAYDPERTTYTHISAISTNNTEQASVLSQILGPNISAQLTTLVIFALVYFIAWYLVRTNFSVNITAVKQSFRWIWLCVCFLALAIIFNLVYIFYVGTSAGNLGGGYLLFQLLDCLCTLIGLALLITLSSRDQLVSDLEILHHMDELHKQHYELNRANLELLNTKFHDIRKGLASVRSHLKDISTQQGMQSITVGSAQVRNDDSAILVPQSLSIESLRALENAIHIYDSIYHTHNDYVDTILTEKSLYCSSQGITLNALVDGAAFDFLDISEIYTLFGNVLDNAIEAVSALPQEKRVINLTGKVVGNMRTLSCSNYYEGSLTIHNDIPATTKVNTRLHGLGMRSIHYTAKKYNGMVTIAAENHVFDIHILFPLDADAS